jgi:N-acetylmuramoyl-L-alanine amidase
MKEFLEKLIEFIKSLFKKENDIIMGNTFTETVIFRSPVKILIDNGHGINTAGKRSPYSATGVKPELPFFEYRWNREVAKEVVDTLCFLGFDAELLVTETEDISLGERVRRVNVVCDELGSQNVILVSIHANAMGNGTKWEKATGWEAYTSLGKTESDNLVAYFYDEVKELFPDKKIRYDWSDGDCDKEESFYIIKHTKCPAVLTENFFYDNIDDTKLITSMDGKQKIIDLHVNAIVNYLENKKGDK